MQRLLWMWMGHILLLQQSRACSAAASAGLVLRCRDFCAEVESCCELNGDIFNECGDCDSNAIECRPGALAISIQETM